MTRCSLFSLHSFVLYRGKVFQPGGTVNEKPSNPLDLRTGRPGAKVWAPQLLHAVKVDMPHQVRPKALDVSQL